MKEYNFVVNFDKNLIISDLKNLVQNDYNTAKLKFTFDKKGRFLFKMVYPDGSKYVTQLENNELVFGPGLLNQDGKYEVEVALYTEEGRLTDFATKTFDVRRELVDTDELIKTDDRLPVLDNLIKDVTDIKTSAENGEFNGKDGITPTIGENGNWFMGDTDTGLPSRGEDGDSSGTVMILSEDDDATKIEKLLSVMEDGKVVRPLFYRTYNSGDEIPGIYELFQSYVDDSGRTFIFKCLFSNVYMVRFTVSSDNTLTKEASKTLWSDFVGTKEITGELENLSTEDKSNLVAAINEVSNSSGNGITELTESTVVLSNLTDGIYFLNPNVNIQYGGTNSYTTGLSNGKYILNVFSYNGKKRAYFINRNNEMIFFNESTSKYKTYSFDTFLTTTTGASKTYVDDLVGDISTVLATLTTVSEVSE